RDLVPEQLRVPVLAARPYVAAGPLAGHGRIRVLRRPAAPLRLLEQRLVVLLRGRERIRAHDRLARIVAVAVAPRGGRGRIVADDPRPRGPLRLERGAAVAAEVARIAPERPVLVEILGRENIDRERLDAVGHG